MTRPAPLAFLFAATALAQSTTGIDVGAGASNIYSSSLVVMGSVKLGTASEDAKLPSDIRLSVQCHTYLYDGGGLSLSGQFNFTFTPNPSTIHASVDCTVEAKEFGYDSTVVKFPVRSITGVVNVGALTLTPNANHQDRERSATTISATSLRAPPNAKKLFDHGMRLLQQQKFPDAAKDFENAIRLYPDYADAWLELGRARVRLESFDTARQALLRAAELEPQLVGPSEELGLLAARQNDLPSAAKYLDEALRLDPGHSFQACYSDAVINLMLKRYDVAERAARAALRFGETGPQARADYVLGMALLAKGDGAAARESLQRYLDLNPKATERDQIAKELARIQ